MRRRIRRLAELGSREWLVLLQLVPAASAISIASHHGQLEPLIHRLGDGHLPAPFFCDGLSEAQLHRLADWATRLILGHKRCLQRSLVLHWLLARRGQAPVLELGVTLQDGRLLSHAWVTVAGSPIGESAAVLAGFRTILRVGVG